jgi:hypothetical protein
VPRSVTTPGPHPVRTTMVCAPVWGRVLHQTDSASSAVCVPSAQLSARATVSASEVHVGPPLRALTPRAASRRSSDRSHRRHAEGLASRRS